MIFGLVVYSFQGQFTLPLAFQGMSSFGWQTLGNVIALITGIIAAGLYGNIGISASFLPYLPFYPVDGGLSAANGVANGFCFTCRGGVLQYR